MFLKCIKTVSIDGAVYTTDKIYIGNQMSVFKISVTSDNNWLIGFDTRKDSQNYYGKYFIEIE